MPGTKKSRIARIVGFVFMGIAIFLLLDDIFFDIISIKRMVTIAMFFLIIALLAFGIARKATKSGK